MNSKLDVKFGGLLLKNPFVVASAPPSESIKTIIQCADAGAGAIVTKSMADFDKNNYYMGARRAYVTKNEFWAQGTFRHETMTLKEGLLLLNATTNHTDVPIIASIGFTSFDPQRILDSCMSAQAAGASMIHLDLFYIPQPRVNEKNVSLLLELISILKEQLTIPVGPKFNNDFPPDIAAYITGAAKPDIAFLLDSQRTPVPIDIFNGGKPKIANLENAAECSLFGPWQKPLTLQYTSILSRKTKVPVCAGGGLANSEDAIEALMHGATTAQFASGIIRHGYRFIGKVLSGLDNFLETQGYHDVNAIIGLAHKNVIDGVDESYVEAKAVVNHDLCIACGKCTNVVFCSDIKLDAAGKVEIEDSCDGCGFCVSVCPIPGSLLIKNQ